MADEFELHQIAERNVRGDPISRERSARREIIESTQFRDNPERSIYFWDKKKPGARPLQVFVKD